MASDEAALLTSRGDEGDLDPRFALVLQDVAAGVAVYRAIRENGWNTKAFYRLISSNEQAGKQYAQAKSMGLDAIADEIIAIADDGSGDTEVRVNASGEEYTVQNSEYAARSRLRIDSRKWLLAKLAPKKYGEKLDVEHAGTINVLIVDSDL